MVIKKKPKQGKYRIVVSLDEGLEPRMARAANDLRWSKNDFINEAIIEKLNSHESE